MLNTDVKTLIYGIGNLGRQDDGLGILLSQKFENFLETKLHIRENAVLDRQINIEGKEIYVGKFSFENNYQLNIEDAYLISEYDQVIFVDASRENIKNGFYFEPLIPQYDFEFTSHALSPRVILGLCEKLYHKSPRCFVLGIQGAQWEVQEELSVQASQNLQKALGFLVNEFQLGKFDFKES